jgi:hypothetical protein
VTTLAGVSVLYKNCFDIVKESCNYILLPSNLTDFGGLIMKKLREFLGYIESNIRRARDQEWSEDEFYRRTRGHLRSINTFGKNLGDLLIYWENKKNLFWTYVSIDPALVPKKMMSLVIAKLGIFAGICEDHEITFTEEEIGHSDGFFVLIKAAQNAKAIEHSANNADLMILADCIVYSTERLPEGIVYLVTNDNELYGTTSAIVEQPKLIFPDITGKFTGLEPLKPRRLVDDFRNRQA